MCHTALNTARRMDKSITNHVCQMYLGFFVLNIIKIGLFCIELFKKVAYLLKYDVVLNSFT